jgi:glycosyltransferase involved in cell wall biosynthesis
MPILKNLPLPPTDKTDWPWTEESNLLPERMPNGLEWPRISIVTPSYNQGQFIEETIRSVLLQGYPNLEYIIIDGGSTDYTIDILQKYDSFLSYWVSEPDSGQSNAINKGLQKVTGQLIGWQNSDDYYGKNAFAAAAIAFSEDSDAGVIYGNVNQVYADSSFEYRRKVCQFSLEDMLPGQCVYNQSMFFNKKIFDDGISINESREYLMDFDLFWNIALNNYRFIYVEELFGNLRNHGLTKTSTISHVMTSDFFQIYKELYADSRFPKCLEEKLKDSMRHACLDSFGKLQLETFRQHAIELARMFGFKFLGSTILLKYLISYLGSDNISDLRKMRNQVTALMN